MLTSAQRSIDRGKRHAVAKEDPFPRAFREYTKTLNHMLLLQKSCGGTDESPELMRVWTLWSRQLDRLVRVVPTTVPGVVALIGLCLDRESVADDDSRLIHDAMRSIAKALKRLFPAERWPARCAL